MRRLLKQQGEVATLEGPLGPTAGLDRMRKVKELAKLGRLEIGDVKEVAAN
jgi:hypothetical protein